MNIGVEARWLFRGSTSGRSIIRGLVEGLSRAVRARAGWHLTLFVDRRDSRLAEADSALSAVARLVPLRYPTRLIGVSLFLGPAVDRERVDALVSPFFVPRRCNAALVCYVFDILFESHPEYFTAVERLYASQIRHSCQRADHLLALSQATRDDLVHYGYAPAEMVDVVYPGTTASPPASREPEIWAPPVPAGSRYFLYVGRLNRRKNIPAILDAAAHVLNDTDTHLLIVGKPDRSMPARLLKPAPHVRDRVHYTGPVEDRALPRLYEGALALVYVPFAEGFGLPIIEAMTFGLPVIGSNAPGVREAIGPAGLAVDPRGVPELTAAMRSIARDAGLRDQLSRKARDWSRRFTWDIAASRTIDCCTRAITRRAGQ